MRFRRSLFFSAALALVIGSASAAPPISNNVAMPSGVTPLTVPASVAGSGNWVSVCVQAAQYRSFDVFADTAGAATLQVQRYADPGCTHAAGAAVPAVALALTSGGGCTGSCGDVGSNDGLSFLAMKITLTDTSGSTNTINSVVLVQGAE